MSYEYESVPESSTPIEKAAQILGCTRCLFFSGKVEENIDICTRPMLDNPAVKDLADVDKVCRLFRSAN